jgi:hypothetical protein
MRMRVPEIRRKNPMRYAGFILRLPADMVGVGPRTKVFNIQGEIGEDDEADARMTATSIASQYQKRACMP